jgi:Uncharacterized protein conserved in bacteria (DUF2252)
MSVLIDEYRQSLYPSRRGLMGRFRYVGGARKVVGVGSVGTRAWVVLLLGRDDSDSLLMQVKEAQPLVLESCLRPSEHANAAGRVVEGQRLMQSNSDILLGWLQCVGPDDHQGDYYIRQLRDWKSRSTPSRLLRNCSQTMGSHAPTSWPVRTPARVIASPSPATSAAVTSPTLRSPSSPRSTPYRMSVNTRPCERPSPQWSLCRRA